MAEYPASELVIRDWARANAGILAAVGGDSRKIDVDYSGDAASTHLTMQRSGGAPDYWVPLDAVVMTFNCWGRGRASALTLATAVVTAVMTRGETQVDDALVRGGVVESNSYLPDPTGQHRYVVIARFVVSARAVA